MSNHTNGKSPNPEMISALTQAAHEIRSLRRTNEVLAAKVEVMDLFAAVLFAQAPRNSQGYGEDVAWKLEKLAEALRAPITDSKPESEPRAVPDN